LTGPGNKELQQLPIACVNSSSENFGYVKDKKKPSLSKIVSSTIWN